MMTADAGPVATRNALWSLAAVGGLLLALFLFAGAYGHFSAVWPALARGAEASGSSRLMLLMPGALLTLTGMVNFILSRALWTQARWALHGALVTNVLAIAYFSYLLGTGVPNHPIGLFLALVSSDTAMLVAIRCGLVWPGR